MTEIGAAYVRIRPNLASFEAETATGVKGALSGVAKAAGLALGGVGLFEFAKTAIEGAQGAAQLQKSVETVKAEFGAASAAALRFGETGAAALGISSAQADATSAKFGILFQNLGIGQREAVGMTVNLEKLAGALSAIRGVDPSQALQSISLAMLGNTRSLKQLGVAIDPASEKLAALKLGLISSTKDAFTPAIRAQAIYALATANLPHFLDLAKAHSHDLANEQRQLTAIWTNAKDTIGSALLPVFSKYTGELVTGVTQLVRSGKLQRDVNSAMKDGAQVVGAFKDAFLGLRPVVKTTVDLLGGVKRTVELIIGLKVLSVVRGWGGAFVTSSAQAETSMATVAGSVNALATEILTRLDTAIASIGATSETAAARTTAAMLSIKGSVSTAGAGALTTKAELAGIGDGAVAGEAKTLGALAGVRGALRGLKGSLLGLVSKPWVIAVALSFIPPNKKGQEALDKAGLGFLGKLPFIGGAEQQVARAGQLTGQAFTKGVNDAFGKQHPTGPQPFKSPFLTETLAQINAGLTALGKKPISEATYELSRRIAEGINAPASKDPVKKAGKKLGADVASSVADGVKQGAPAVSSAVSKASAAAIAAAAKQRIDAAVTGAKSNLDRIGQELAATLDKFTAKAGGTVSGAGGAAFDRLKALIKAGAPEFEIARAATGLKSELQNIGKGGGQTATKTTLADLTDSFNKGRISLKAFNKRFATILADDHVSYKRAGKLLGGAFADGYKAEVEGLIKQAALIAAVPKHLRGVGGGGGAATVKLVNPLEVIRQENARTAATASKERGRIAKAAEKTAAGVAALKNVHVGPLPGHGKTPPGHAAHKAKASAGAGVQP